MFKGIIKAIINQPFKSFSFFFIALVLSLNLCTAYIIDKAADNTRKEVLGSDVEYRRIETVGPQVGNELKIDGAVASLIAILAISAYIWIRFAWQFALGALLGLFHDIIITFEYCSFKR